jgi:AraC-like DNA-binding protein
MPTGWPAQTNGLMRVSILSQLPGVVASLCGNFDDICAAAGEIPGCVSDPDQMMPYQRVGNLLAISSQQTGCPHLGLLLGAAGGLGSLGLVGLMMKYAPTVGHALSIFERNLHLQDRAAALSLAVEPPLATFSYSLNGIEVTAAEQVVDGAIALGLRLMQGLCGDRFAPEEVLLARRRPADPAAWHQVFKAPVRFNAELSGLVFPARWLELVNPQSDPDLLRILEDRARQLSEDRAVLFSDMVRKAIRPLIMSQRCSARAAADMFRIGKRTMNRRLSEEGTDFRTLTDEVRFDVARHLLRNTEMSLSEIALVLGYAEASALTRAFRRWTGRAPRDWRLRSRNGSGLSGSIGLTS